MDILLDNPLATMYGPYFLLFYGFVITFTVIVLAIIKSQVDKSDNMNLPTIPPHIDPYEIAYLRGGTNEVARSVVFALMQKGFIELYTEGNKAEIRQTDKKPNQSELSQLEQLTLGWFYTPRQSYEVFWSTGLIEQLQSYSQMYQSRLEQQQMLVDDDMRGSLSMVKWTAYLLILGLGMYKFLASIIHGYYNVIFLIIFLIVGLVIAKLVSRLPRLTKLGNAYLERLQDAFSNLKYQAQALHVPKNQPMVAPQGTFAGVDPLLLSVGVFGSAVLAGTVYEQYNQAFHRQQQQATNGSSCGSAGCGSSCSTGSSCSSGDSGGSSCSSGSSCGSSCGGGCGGGGD